MASTELPELVVPDSDALREWLDAHHEQATGVWLVLAKKGTTDPTTLTYDQALTEALCQGWIDGQAQRRDEGTYCVRFTPRRARSQWSARNVGIVTALMQEGRMQPAGMAQVVQAKADGRWDAAYGGQATIEVPADLAEALEAAPAARAMFDILTRQNRYVVVYQVDSAKRSDTRSRRIEKFVSMLARGETAYPQKRKLDS
ncbi:MAG TPA: YdeI/OmpD-associated family protein [Dermatophilaceae bacterium]|nr:YdeI/OmpD-associated family protein [Dermatophilaceae bacterium]